MSYVAFLGLFTQLYGRGDIARHGRRGFVIFVGEAVGFILLDVVRVRLGWPTTVFAPAVGAVAVIMVVLIIKALRTGPRGRARGMQ